MRPSVVVDALNETELPINGKQDSVSLCTPTSTGVGTSPASIDPAKEKGALRRFDLIVLPQLGVLTVIGWLDRANIGESEVIPVKGCGCQRPQAMPPSSA